MHTVLNHPLIEHKLTQMRRKEASTKEFRQNLDEITGLMVYEIMHDIPIRRIEVETPVGLCAGGEITKDIVLVPVLRAGLGMLDGIVRLIPEARVGLIGLYRDHDTLQPHEYYAKFPDNLEKSITIILDPMLATGGSAAAAIASVKQRGAKVIKLVCLVGAPEGLDHVEKEHSDVDVYLAALDEKLNEKGYIVPGLGDAGDRIFGTS